MAEMGRKEWLEKIIELQDEVGKNAYFDEKLEVDNSGAIMLTKGIYQLAKECGRWVKLTHIIGDEWNAEFVYQERRIVQFIKEEDL